MIKADWKKTGMELKMTMMITNSSQMKNIFSKQQSYQTRHLKTKMVSYINVF